MNKVVWELLQYVPGPLPYGTREGNKHDLCVEERLRLVDVYDDIQEAKVHRERLERASQDWTLYLIRKRKMVHAQQGQAGRRSSTKQRKGVAIKASLGLPALP